MGEQDFEWIETGGGPLLLLPTNLLTDWDGADFSEDREIRAEARWIPEGPATDYDRACDLGEIGLLPVGSGLGLVLGDEPLPTAWIANADGKSGLFVRWISAESDDDIRRVLRELPAGLFAAQPLSFPVQTSSLVLFDSAMPGTDIRTPSLTVALTPGAYAVHSADFAPDPATSVVLHRLTRM